MTALAEAFVRVRADTGDVKKDVGKSFDAAGRIGGGRMASAMKKPFTAGLRGIAGLAAGAFAVDKVASFFKESVTGWRDHQKVVAQTAAVVKSTGGAAQVTVKHVSNLSDALERQTGVDGDLVQTGANMLLTFTNLRNGVGKNNKIFDRATRTVTDMSVALGTDTRSSAIQLGKALNDPVKGVTALQRVGVSFTEAQKKQIAGMVKSGNVMGAQKLILRELGKEFGGSAKSQRTWSDRLLVAWHALQDQVGQKLLPVLDRFTAWLTKRAVPAMAKLVGKVDVAAWAKRVGHGIGVAVDGVRLFVGFLTGHGSDVSRFSGTTVANVADIAGAVRGLVGDVVRLVRVGWRVLGVVLTTVVAPVLKTVAGLLLHHRNVVKGLAIGMAVLLAVTKAHSAVLAVEAAGGLVKYLKGMRLVSSATKIWTALQWLLNAALSANPIGIVIAVLAGLVIGIVVAYKKSETFRRVVQAAFHAVGQAATWLWERAIRPALKLIVGAWLDMASAIVSGAAKAFGWVPGLGPKLRGAADQFRKFRDHVNDALSGIHDHHAGVKVTYNGKPAVFTRDGLHVFGGTITRGLARGGPVFGPGTGTSDTAGIFALSNDEHVWTAREVAGAGGHPAVAQLRKLAAAGKLPGLRAGGPATNGLTTLPMFESTKALREWAALIDRQLAATARSQARKIAASGFGGQGLAFAKAQVGKPYIWGGVGPAGFDCSGFMSAITNVIRGDLPPYHRLFSTASFAGGRGVAGFVRGLRSPFMIGVLPGSHMAGTLNGVNVESSGSIGPHVGPTARGAFNSMFPYQFGLSGLRSARRDRHARGAEGATFDLGGLATGPGFLPKLTRRPERMLSPRQTSAFERLVDVLDRGGRPLRVASGRLVIEAGPGGGLEAWVRDLVVQEQADAAAFARRR